MIDLIRESSVPAPVMRSAARGALSLPAGEMVEILVYLSDHPMFGEQARLSLAGFDQAAMKEVAADPLTPVPVLDYLASPQNVRPALLPVLLENSSLPESSLTELAQSRSTGTHAAMLASDRVRRSHTIIETLLTNQGLDANLRMLATDALARLSSEGGEVLAAEPGPNIDVLGIDEEVSKFIDEHAEEIRTEEAKTFELTDLTEEEKVELQVPVVVVKEKPDKARMSPLQRIAQMSVGDRVQLGMKGSREDRYILIRDGSKVVSSAVLESPKLTDQEVETFAAMKNVQQSVLRGIAGKRKFMKLYPVMRALTANPRCPLDVALPIMKSLLVQDLRGLSMNKNVSDTLRKVALKMYKEKSASKKSGE